MYPPATSIEAVLTLKSDTISKQLNLFAFACNINYTPSLNLHKKREGRRKSF